MKKIKKIMLLSTIIVLSAHSCIKERNESLDDKLTLERVDYNGLELKIDGYYYEKIMPNNRIHVFFLYKNGIILDDGTSRDFDEVEGHLYNAYSAYKFLWGVFQVNGTRIKYEKWTPSDGPLDVFTYEGTILNDTTYVILESYRNVGGEKTLRREISREFHFRKFSPKPDSVNRFIE